MNCDWAFRYASCRKRGRNAHWHCTRTEMGHFSHRFWLAAMWCSLCTWISDTEPTDL